MLHGLFIKVAISRSSHKVVHIRKSEELASGAKQCPLLPIWSGVLKVERSFLPHALWTVDA